MKHLKIFFAALTTLNMIASSFVFASEEFTYEAEVCNLGWSRH